MLTRTAECISNTLPITPMASVMPILLECIVLVMLTVDLSIQGSNSPNNIETMSSNENRSFSIH